MSDKKSEVSVEAKTGHYAGILHTLTHARAEMPQHCEKAVVALDTAIEKTSALLTSLLDSEMPRAH